jgi:hypothetical protein
MLLSCDSISEETQMATKLWTKCPGLIAISFVRVSAGLIDATPVLLAAAFAGQRGFHAPLLAGWDIEGMSLDLFDDVLLLNFPLKPAQGALERFMLAQTNFCHAIFTPFTLLLSDAISNLRTTRSGQMTGIGIRTLKILHEDLSLCKRATLAVFAAEALE